MRANTLFLPHFKTDSNIFVFYPEQSGVLLTNPVGGGATARHQGRHSTEALPSFLLLQRIEACAFVAS